VAVKGIGIRGGGSDRVAVQPEIKTKKQKSEEALVAVKWSGVGTGRGLKTQPGPKPMQPAREWVEVGGRHPGSPT
jgi:hypothetical protein